MWNVCFSLSRIESTPDKMCPLILYFLMHWHLNSIHSSLAMTQSLFIYLSVWVYSLLLFFSLLHLSIIFNISDAVHNLFLVSCSLKRQCTIFTLLYFVISIQYLWILVSFIYPLCFGFLVQVCLECILLVWGPKFHQLWTLHSLI